MPKWGIKKYDSVVVIQHGKCYTGLFIDGDIMSDPAPHSKNGYYFRAEIYHTSFYPTLSLHNIDNVYNSRIMLIEKIKEPNEDPLQLILV